MVSNVGLWEEVVARLQEKRDKYTSPETTFILGLLNVHPESRGLGAARAMIEWGLQQADEKGAEAYLEAAPELAPLFEKFGWVVVDEICFDLDQWDVLETGVQRWVCMLRKPEVSN